MNSLLRKMKVVGLSAAVVSLIALSGCAEKGTHQVVEPLTTKVSDYKQVNVTVFSKRDDVQSQLKAIQEQIDKQLADQFSVVSLAANSKKAGVLDMKLEVVDYHAVGGAAHFFVGGLVAPDMVSVRGILTDMATGKKLGVFNSTGEAHLSGIVTGNTGTVRASIQLGKQIAELMKTNM